MLSEVSNLTFVVGPYRFRMAKERFLDICLWPRAVEPRLFEFLPEAARSPFVPGRPDGSLEV